MDQSNSQMIPVLTIKLKGGHPDEEKMITNIIKSNNLKNIVNFDPIKLTLSIRIDQYDRVRTLFKYCVGLPPFTKQQLEEAAGC